MSAGQGFIHPGRGGWGYKVWGILGAFSGPLYGKWGQTVKMQVFYPVSQVACCIPVVQACGDQSRLERPTMEWVFHHITLSSTRHCSWTGGHIFLSQGIKAVLLKLCPWSWNQVSLLEKWVPFQWIKKKKSPSWRQNIPRNCDTHTNPLHPCFMSFQRWKAVFFCIIQAFSFFGHLSVNQIYFSNVTRTSYCFHFYWTTNISICFINWFHLEGFLAYRHKCFHAKPRRKSLKGSNEIVMNLIDNCAFILLLNSCWLHAKSN